MKLEAQLAAQTRLLQESGQIERVILEATNQSIVVINTNGIILMANSKAAKRMNIPLGDFLGACVYDMMSAELASSRKAMVDRVAKSGKPVTMVDHRDGIWLETELHPIFDVDGRVENIVVHARDISEQKITQDALLESEEKYRRLAEAANDLVYVIGEDGRIEYANSHAAEVLGMRREDLIGLQHVSLFPKEAAKQNKEVLDATLASGNAIYTENWMQFGDRAMAYASTWLVPLPIRADGRRSLLGVSRDITTLKRTQEQLESALDQFEKQVKERTAELAASQDQLRVLATKVISTQEEERRRISSVLHDEAGQELIALMFALEDARRELPNEDFTNDERISNAILTTQKVVKIIRDLAHDLHPLEIEVGGSTLPSRFFAVSFPFDPP